MLRDEKLTNLSAQVELLATQIRKNDEEIIYDLTDLMRIHQSFAAHPFYMDFGGYFADENAW